jgi:hypothetical protein
MAYGDEEWKAEARVLGPEMQAEGWEVVGGDWIMWLHPPSKRSVSVDGPMKRENAFVPSLLDAPCDPQADGYVVSCREHDDHGNPMRGENFWVESYGRAVAHARRIRKSILDEMPSVATSEQLTLDEVLKVPLP